MISTSTYIVEHARALNGVSVSYQGEVVGDIMVRGPYAWVNVADATNGIGVFMKKELAAPIKYKGVYGLQGDTVVVSGTLNYACAVHGGDMDIHAHSLQVIAQGKHYYKVIEPATLKLALFSVCLVLVCMWLSRKYLN